MKFDYSAYEAVFPPVAPEIKTDSAVEGYTPTAEEAQTATPGKIESAVETEDTNTPSDNAQPTGSPTNADKGIKGLEGGTTSTEGKIEP